MKYYVWGEGEGQTKVTKYNEVEDGGVKIMDFTVTWFRDGA